MHIAPIAVVEAFIDAWNAMDFTAIVDLLADDVVYHNIPMTPLHGRDAVRDYLTSAGPFDSIHWQTLNIAAAGDVVLTERVDNFVKQGKRISLPVMGVFEIRNGKITAWRDYFDLESYRRQLM
jgi:limonene-1,2-epoxide hydrolase